jgi:hypothetical protein
LADKRTESSATRRELNRNVRMAVKRFDLSGTDEETWDFLCECGLDDCQEWVTLRIEEYERLQRVNEPILAPGHTLTEGEVFRRRARRLVGDARALGAQAEHQLNRAQRILKENEPG